MATAKATTVNYGKTGKITTAKVAKHINMNLVIGLGLFNALLWLHTAYVAIGMVK